MKIKGSIDINASRDIVVDLFQDPDNLKKYQDSFIRKVQVSGVPGEVGAIANMYYEQGKGEMELVETVTLNDLPHRFEAHYHHIHMDNTMKCFFKEINENLTRYEYEYEYTRINWIMPKLMSILFPGMFRKPPEKWLRQFKELAEKQ